MGERRGAAIPSRDTGGTTIHAFEKESDEDRRQEIATRRLEKEKGITPPPVTRSREYGYGLVPGEGQIVDENFTINFRALERIIEWSMEQSALVRLAVVEYLEEPGDEHLEAVLDLIDVQAPVAGTKRKEASLTSLIVHALPATIEELYVLARRQHRSHRPEAAVRQTIRNLRKKGSLLEDERGRLCLVVETASSLTPTSK